MNKKEDFGVFSKSLIKLPVIKDDQVVTKNTAHQLQKLELDENENNYIEVKNTTKKTFDTIVKNKISTEINWTEVNILR